METHDVTYKIKTASEKDIFLCLSECSRSFAVSLDTRVNISNYAKKLSGKSVTFEAWIKQLLVGFVAGYFNDTASGSAFISNVSVLEKYRGLGIASKLLDMCINYAKKYNFHDLALEVFKEDTSSIHLYNKFGFKNYETKRNTIIIKRNIV